MKLGDEIPDRDADQYITVAQAARRVRMSIRTIRNWMADGKLRVRYTVGGQARIWEPSLWRDRPQD